MRSYSAWPHERRTRMRRMREARADEGDRDAATAVSPDDVERARQAIGGRLHRTPTFTSRTLSELTGARIRLKAELFQRTGSFKPRGVLTNLAALSPDEKARGVIGISAGNHAAALAYGAALEDISALLVMWQGASEQKIEATRAYGADVDLAANGPGEAFDRLAELTADSGRTLVHPFDSPATTRCRSSASSSTTSCWSPRTRSRRRPASSTAARSSRASRRARPRPQRSSREKSRTRTSPWCSWSRAAMW